MLLEKWRRLSPETLLACALALGLGVYGLLEVVPYLATACLRMVSHWRQAGYTKAELQHGLVRGVMLTMFAGHLLLNGQMVRALRRVQAGRVVPRFAAIGRGTVVCTEVMIGLQLLGLGATITLFSGYDGSLTFGDAVFILGMPLLYGYLTLGSCFSYWVVDGRPFSFLLWQRGALVLPGLVLNLGFPTPDNWALLASLWSFAALSAPIGRRLQHALGEGKSDGAEADSGPTAVVAQDQSVPQDADPH